MKSSKLVLLAALVLVAMDNAHAQSWDFEFSYQNVYASNALSNVVEQANITQRSEGAITYWCPIANGQEARFTQKFTFPWSTEEAFLNVDYIYIANFSASLYGSGSLWGSKDGVNWVQLVDAPRPSEIAAGYGYKTNLPPSLLGSKELWVQARLVSQGWNIMAQYLRYDTRYRTNNCFDLMVKYRSPRVDIVKAISVDFSDLELGSNYQLEASSDMSNWTNWGAPFTATNTHYTNVIPYQRVDNWDQLFFRLQEQ